MKDKLYLYVDKAYQIYAPASKIWKFFTVPFFSRKMGGQYLTDWKEGSPLSWRNLEGEIVTNGTILKIIPEKLLKHTILDTQDPKRVSVTAILTYEFYEKEGITTIFTIEEFTHPISEKEYNDAKAGWDAALLFIKELVETQD
jgi:uncharacterized protein YndB with AHSA1/START domain